MKCPSHTSLEEAKDYFINHGLERIVDASQEKAELGVNEKLETRIPYKPDLIDLCRLHRFVIDNKRTTILEFGTGWSTWIFADALLRLKAEYAGIVRNLRRNNPFELHVVDDEPEFIDIAKSRVPGKLQDLTFFHLSNTIMDCFNNRICTFYEALPLISPDMIYVDGPNQFNAHSHVNGWSTRHKDMMPMSGDLLRIEHFLTPGTIVFFDGRAANVRFFRSNAQRVWDYQYDEKFDQHILQLNEAPLGKLNLMQLEFYAL